MYGHVNNSIYSFLIDSIINAYLREQCGIDPQTSEQIGLVVNSYCDFFQPLSYPAVVHLGLRVVRMGRSSAKYEVGVFEEGKEDVSAGGGSTHVFVDRESKKAAEDGMTEDVRVGLEKLLQIEVAKL